MQFKSDINKNKFRLPRRETDDSQKSKEQLFRLDS